MKQSEIVQLTTEEVAERIEVISAQQEGLKRNHAVSSLENPMQLRQNRRTIARLKTELKKRQLNG